MKRCLFVLPVALTLIAASISSCIDESGHAPDISGFWHGTIVSDIDSLDTGNWEMNISRTRKTSFLFSRQTTYTGTYSAKGVWGSTGLLKMNVEFDLENVTLTYASGSFKAVFTGKLTDGDTLSGTYIQSSNIIGLSPAGLSGKWIGVNR